MVEKMNLFCNNADEFTLLVNNIQFKTQGQLDYTHPLSYPVIVIPFQQYQYSPANSGLYANTVSNNAIQIQYNQPSMYFGLGFVYMCDITKGKFGTDLQEMMK